VMLRRACIDDLPGIMGIEDGCFGAERFSPITIQAFLVREDTFVAVAEIENRIVGAAMCMHSKCMGEGRIASVAVLPEFRGQGLGGELLDQCEKEFRLLGLTKFTLEVETINAPAVDLYISRGYAVRGIIKNYYSEGRDAYLMEKTSPMKGKRFRIKLS